MFVEFFCSRDPCRTAFAWFGLFFVVAYCLIYAWVSLAINQWYGDFYNLAQVAAKVALVANGTSNVTVAEAAQAEAIGTFWDLMRRFLYIATGYAALAPVASFIGSHYSFAWRMALIESYIARWSALGDGNAIEGASQRVHEDTQRFSSALRSGMIQSLSSVLTIVAFTPRMLQLSRKTPVPRWFKFPKYLSAFNFFLSGDVWLFNVAFATAIIGMVGAVIVGQKLVGLEVNNQRVEAELRKRLVLAEDDDSGSVNNGASNGKNGGNNGFGVPTLLARLIPKDNGAKSKKSHNKPLNGDGDGVNGHYDGPDPRWERPRSPEGYSPILTRLFGNYSSLFVNFLSFNMWVGSWKQFVIIVPYLLIGPQLFDLYEPIPIGVLTQVEDAFQQIFMALTVAMDNWASVNEFRSVCRRLTEFEASLPTMADAAAAAKRGATAVVEPSPGAEQDYQRLI